MHQHIHMDLVMNADAHAIDIPAHTDLFLFQGDVQRARLLNHSGTYVLVAIMGVGIVTSDLVQFVLKLVVVEIRGDQLPADVNSTKNNEQRKQRFYFPHTNTCTLASRLKKAA